MVHGPPECCSLAGSDKIDDRGEAEEEIASGFLCECGRDDLRMCGRLFGLHARRVARGYCQVHVAIDQARNEVETCPVDLLLTVKPMRAALDRDARYSFVLLGMPPLP